MNVIPDVICRLALLADESPKCFFHEASRFFECVMEIERCALSLAAISQGGLRLEILRLDRARAQTCGPTDLCVFCYAWALRRLLLGHVIAAVEIGESKGLAIDLREFKYAVAMRNVRDARFRR